MVDICPDHSTFFWHDENTDKEPDWLVAINFKK
jgi:hypothetical protein